MAITFKTPSQVGDEYLLHLKALKPDINEAQEDSDWFIRSRVLGGTLAGVYSDQLAISNDALPPFARHEALDRHLFTYFNGTFNSATHADGVVLVSGATGSFADVGQLIMTYAPNGNQYTNNQSILLTATTGTVTVTSVGTGQIQNLLEGTQLTIGTPPAGFGSSATVFGGPIADGRDDESDAEAAARILLRIRSPISGGKVSDYIQWALEADPSVVSANVLRFPLGLGTVGIVLTAGTTNIDAALDAGNPIVQVPSDALVQIVSDYIETKKPITDCATVFKPQILLVDVTVRVRYLSGNGSTIPSGQTLTQDQLVIREVKRSLYKTAPGGVQFGGSGFVLASAIEQQIDAALGAPPLTPGTITLVTDRQVNNLAATGPNLMIAANQIVNPGVISIVSF